MVTSASALVLLAGMLCVWPRARAVVRLERMVTAAEPGGSRSPRAVDRRLPAWSRSVWLRRLVAVAAVGGLSMVWPLPVAAVVVAVVATVGAALARGRRERAAVRAEQAAVEGLGVLVAELRAGRPPAEAFATAGRHSGHPVVGALLGRLGRSLRLGDHLSVWGTAGERPPRTTPGLSVSRVARTGREGTRTDCPRWQARLIAGAHLSQRTGCGLAEVVAAVESDLDRHERQRADLRATAAGHRATVALLAGLPILGLAMGSGIGAEPVRILTTTVIGQVLLVVGVALELLGLAWSRGMSHRALQES